MEPLKKFKTLLIEALQRLNSELHTLNTTMKQAGEQSERHHQDFLKSNEENRERFEAANTPKQSS